MAKKRSNFYVQKSMLRWGGISLREHESTTYKVFAFSITIIICAYPFIALTDVFRQDFEAAADLLKYEFIFIVASIKYMFVQAKRVELRKLLDKLEPEYLDHLKRKHNKEEEILKLGNYVATYQTIIYWCFTFAAYTSNFIYSLSKRIRSNDYHDWQYTYGSFNIVNGTYSPNFEILWGYQAFSCFFLGSQFVMIDTTMGGILCYVCFELKVLQSNLKWIVESKQVLKEEYNKKEIQISNEAQDLTLSENSVSDWNVLHGTITQTVAYHLAIISIVDELNKTFSSLLLMTFLGTLGMLTLMVYKVSMIPLNDIRVVTSLSEIGVIILQILIICFWSDEMMFEGEQVGKAAYQANFVGTDLRFQKSLVLIIRGSQTPLTLGAGKFVDIRLSTFVWIVRSAYSVFTVLRNHNSAKID